MLLSQLSNSLPVQNGCHFENKKVALNETRNKINKIMNKIIYLIIYQFQYTLSFIDVRNRPQ